jgi:hypothetical protein
MGGNATKLNELQKPNSATNKEKFKEKDDNVGIYPQ